LGTPDANFCINHSLTKEEYSVLTSSLRYF
jgi:hypothetical protein